MDDVNRAQAQDLPVQGPHLRLHSSAALPANFCPLRLVLQPGGASIDVNRPDMLVGRHTDCDIRLPLPDVSRRHCRLQFIEGGWQVIDLNSLNGTQVNGEQVLQAPLDQGDLVKIGSFTFAVDLVHLGASGGSDHVQSIIQTLSSSSQRKAS
jgi:pSer/pThr/pTyr-binding forkhead associated (FHA) protein